MDQFNRNSIQFTENGLFVSAHFLGNQVGRVNAVDKGDGTVLLGNIEVDERVEIRGSLLDQFIRRVRPTWGVVFPRKRKIGSELLRRFVQACERAGIREIYGNVTPEADRDQPFLKGWYEGFGFVASPPDGRDEWFPVKYKVVWTRSKDGLPRTPNPD